MPTPSTPPIVNPALVPFFRPIANTRPFFKAAIHGFAGTGKTHTATNIAIGLHKRIKSAKPVVIFDTERSSKFLHQLFTAEKIEAQVKESRSLADLKEAMRLCREGYSDILIVDSLSHVWENFVEAYLRATKKQRLELLDWGIIKPTFKREFNEPFVVDPYHIIICGRSGYEYESEVNDETGKREIHKSGIKFKGEGEVAYEPDLLVLMDRHEKVLGDEKEAWRTATVLKDRSRVIDGKTFRNPTYADFAPCIEYLLSGAPVVPTVNDLAEQDAAALVATDERSRTFKLNRDIALEKIEAYLTKVYPGQSADAKKTKIEAVEFAFGTTSWTEVTKQSPTRLNEGLGKLHQFVLARTSPPSETTS